MTNTENKNTKEQTPKQRKSEPPKMEKTSKREGKT